jgi:hypothetical protein
MKPDLTDEERETLDREAAKSGNWLLGLVVFLILAGIAFAISLS